MEEKKFVHQVKPFQLSLITNKVSKQNKVHQVKPFQLSLITAQKSFSSIRTIRMAITTSLWPKKGTIRQIHHRNMVVFLVLRPWSHLRDAKYQDLLPKTGFNNK